MTEVPLPRVGVGCIVMNEGRVLLVQSRRTGRWSTPGGNLDFGESPTDCAVRETMEETGIAISNARFVAITNDIIHDTGRHYVTVWMAGDPDSIALAVQDSEEIAEVGWFDPADLPTPLHVYFENLLAGNTLPLRPPNMPFATPALADPDAR
jgi:8-oxo-dGTP diphosphatase